MTIYAGETVTITHTATDLDNTTALTDGDVDSVTIVIYDSDLAEVVSETAMTWDSDESRWEYVWDTSPGATPVNIDSGTYRAMVTITGLDDSTNWEYKRIRLARNPV